MATKPFNQFARRLHAAMVAKGMNNSDLARAVWGETEDNKGYKVARNRDRIGVYLKGRGFPEPRTLGKIAKALGTTSEELAPEVMVSPLDDTSTSDFAMHTVPGQADKVFVRINMMLPLGVAVEISRLIERSQRAAPVPGIDSDIEE
jgi:hypothetical protein